MNQPECMSPDVSTNELIKLVRTDFTEESSTFANILKKFFKLNYNNSDARDVFLQTLPPILVHKKSSKLPNKQKQECGMGFHTGNKMA